MVDQETDKKQTPSSNLILSSYERGASLLANEEIGYLARYKIPIQLELDTLWFQACTEYTKRPKCVSPQAD